MTESRESRSDVAVRGGAVTVGGRILRHGVGFAATVTLARMLPPHDFGVVAMVAAVAYFVNRFIDLGLSIPTVQSPRMDFRVAGTLFWVNVLFGLLLGTGLAASGPALAAFYGDDRITGIATAFGATFVLGGLTVQHRALLRRRLRFGTLARIDVLAAVLGAGVAVVAALRGAGHVALVTMPLTASAVTMVGVHVAGRWWPGAPSFGAGARASLAFGGRVATAELVRAAVRSVDRVLVGRIFGAHGIAFYGMAWQLVQLQIALIQLPMGQVAVPVLSRLHDEPRRFRSWYRTGVAVLLASCFPLVVVLGTAAERIVLVVFGPQWADVAPILRALSPGALVMVLDPALDWLYHSRADSGRQLRWALVSSGVTLAAIGVGLRFGPLGVAMGFSAAKLGLVLPGILYAVAPAPVTARDLFDAGWRPLLLSFAAAVALLAVRIPLGIEDPLIGLTVDLGIFGVAYGGGWWLVPGGPEFVARVRRGAMSAPSP